MKNYYRVMLGKQSIYAPECFAGNFIGADFGISEDLTGKLPDDRPAFSQEFIPIYLASHPGKTKVAAGLSCGFLWTVCKKIKNGDIVLCPDGIGRYRVGEVTGDYFYQPGDMLPHRRPVRWFDEIVARSDMNEALRNATGAIGTVSNITNYHDEIEKLIGSCKAPTPISMDKAVEDPTAFALEKHLEDFLVQNWASTDLGREYDIYEVEGERVGQQYETDTGTIDILAISKDKKRLLVVELKKGRASDVVVGQVLRYMGDMQEELAEDGQAVHGVIIALEDDQRICRALKAAQNVVFYRYQISFKLLKT